MKSQAATTGGQQATTRHHHHHHHNHQHHHQHQHHQNQQAAANAPTHNKPRAHLLAGSHVKSSLSRLHNLVTARLSPTPPRTAKLLAGEPHHNNSHSDNNHSPRPAQAYMSKQQASPMATAGHHQRGAPHSSTVSEKIGPELAKCYDEIDQIYDYIRGLAPLPVQLRKIKSIDFEQLERERRLLEHQHLQALESKSRQQQQQQLHHMPARQLMRESSGDETTTQTLLLSKQPGPGLSAKPLRLTTCLVAEGPPLPPVSSVKRVESLNLGSSHRPSTAAKLQASAAAAGHQQPLLATPHQRLSNNSNNNNNNQFRLPRAHSTSTLNKRSAKPPVGRLLAASAARPQVFPAYNEQSQEATRTLPGLSISRASIARSSSLKRSTSASRQQVSCEQQKRQPAGKPADFVESFVDDDDVSSVGSASTRLSGSRSCSSSAGSSRASGHTKSHSDYDNDTASLSGSSTATTTSNSFGGDPAAEQQPKAARPGTRRRCSSGGGTTSSANHRLAGSHSSSSGRPASPSTTDNKQVRPIAEHIYEQIPAHKLLLAGQQAGRVKQYPVMYAPSMALTTRNNNNNTASRLATCAVSKGLHSSSHALPLRPNQQARQRAAPSSQPSATSPSTTTTTTNQDHLPRLSMNSLHLSPFMAFESAAARRRTSAQPLFRLKSRAPPLSPAQLIGQCQMPRAVSKRRLQRPAEAPGTPPPTAQPDGHSTPVWSKQLASQEAATGRHQPQKEQQPGAGFRWLKRDPNRRLTAIGIEQALECMKTAQKGLRDSSMLLNLEQPRRAEQLATKGDKQVPLKNSEQRNHLASDRKQPSRFLNSISDLHSFSSCSSSQSDTGSLPDQSVGCCNSSGGSVHHSPARQPLHRQQRHAASSQEPADEWNEAGNFVSSRSFIKCYYGNEEKENVAGEEEQEEEEEEEEEDFLAPVVGPAERAATDSGSSRASRQPASKATAAEPNNKPTTNQRKRNGSDRLLGLIGLQTSSARRLAHNKAHNRSAPTATETQPSNRLTEPRASLPGTGSRQTLSASFFQQRPSLVATGSASANAPASVNIQQASSALVGHFLNSEGPILVRDRRLASVAPNMVQYYQHPCVQVRKMPAANQLEHEHRQRAVSRRSLAWPALSTTDSSTNSTSSYEAAIKNSNATETSPESGIMQSSQGPEMRVSSLSSSSCSNQKQQRLLSRPLPNPPGAPVSSSTSSHGGTRSRASSRATPVSTNLDLAGLTASKPSPTVTTCTSSGISSRLTCPATSGQRVKSLSELHKQSKRRQLGQHLQQPSTATVTDQKEPVRTKAKQVAASARKEPESEMSSSLKLFDENFSSKFADKQLASSSDSLLESINFSGTLNRKPALANAVGSSS